MSAFHVFFFSFSSFASSCVRAALTAVCPAVWLLRYLHVCVGVANWHSVVVVVTLEQAVHGARRVVVAGRRCFVQSAKLTSVFQSELLSLRPPVNNTSLPGGFERCA